MKTVRVVNLTRAEVLAEHACLADNLWTRFWGLMGHRTLPPGGGLVLEPGGPIHMLFMRMPLDVVHVDRGGQVTHVLRGISPWRFGPLRVGSHRTIELAAGNAARTLPGDSIAVEASP